MGCFLWGYSGEQAYCGAIKRQIVRQAFYLSFFLSCRMLIHMARKTSIKENTQAVTTELVVMRDTRTIIPCALNVKTHPQSQIDLLAKLILQNGFTRPLVCVGDNLKAGHGALMAAQQLWEAGEDIYPAPGKEAIKKQELELSPFDKYDLPVINASGWSDEQASAYMISDNRMSEMSLWAYEPLADILRDIEGHDFETGFSEGDIRELLGKDDSDFLAVCPDTTNIKDSQPPMSPKKSDVGYVVFDIILKKEDRDFLVGVLNKVKQAHGLKTNAEALVYVLRGWNEN